MKPIHADTSHFDELVMRSTKPALVDFWADWCPPCRVLGPMLEDAAAELGDDVAIVKVDADKCPELMQRFGITSIPTLILFHAGKELERRIGPEGLAPLSARAQALVA